MFPFPHGSGNIRFANLGTVNTNTDKKTNTQGSNDADCNKHFTFSFHKINLDYAKLRN